MPCKSLGLGILSVLLAGGVGAQPVISFEEAAIVARGLPPGGQAVLFGIAREPAGFFTKVVRRQEMLRVDASGQVRLSLDRTVPFNSVWFVTDFSTGIFVVGRPQASAARELPFPPDAVRIAVPGRAGRLTSKIGFVEILYVRPGRGVWGMTVGHRGENDDPDTRDHDVSAALDRLVPIGASPAAPSDFANGDVIFLIDPRQLQFFATRLVALPAGGGS